MGRRRTEAGKIEDCGELADDLDARILTFRRRVDDDPLDELTERRMRDRRFPRAESRGQSLEHRPKGGDGRRVQRHDRRRRGVGRQRRLQVAPLPVQRLQLRP
ncbi:MULTISPECIES: hypothetical protein [Methylosinus]|uniref:hypothetical protein n=1 Tax=Methylosinus TaxID=425 RepID=UPI00059114BF|nr:MULTISPECIES: hypothetical protein [Methylosinus]OBS51803.1 hypothetical protein A8B73_14180 [Methylosinus sp. 3S-1]